MTSVSVIIPTYNRAHLLEGTLRSFAKQDYERQSYELIVADNGSSDATRQVVEHLMEELPVRIRYVFEPRRGVHFARNSAAKLADGDILYFTDDDMVADSALLREIVGVFSLDPRIGVATGRIFPHFEVTPPEWVDRCLFNAYLSLSAREMPEELLVSSEDMVFSCHQAVRRQVFFASGGFNPENTGGIWIGDGETGLNMKIRAAGYLFAYTAKSVIYHIIPRERMTLSYLIRRIGNQGYCDSFTAYRRHRSRQGIVNDLVRRNTYGWARLIAITLIMILLRRESVHFIPARVSYLIKRNRYDIRLLFDDTFRTIAEIDDWLADDVPDTSLLFTRGRL